MKKKILLAIIVVVVLTILGLTVHLYNLYENTESVIIKKYSKEVEDVIILNENETVIKAEKYDFNNDNNSDYLLLIGKLNANNNKENMLADFNPDVEAYLDVSLEYINGDSKEVKRFDTTKKFSGNVNLSIDKDNLKTYILVNDNTTGNVILNTIQDNNFFDILKNSFDTDFNGYTFTTSWNAEDTTKLKVKLDNYGRSYLPNNTEEYTLDFSNTSITKDIYRQSYMANKFANIKLEDIDIDGLFEVICEQNILYLNTSSETSDKNAGKICITFKLNDNKLTYNNIEVKI